MAYQPATATWTEDVYCISEDDDVYGGPDGPDNKPILDLACRDLYLRQVIGEVAATEEIL
jgi:hypothetical protein